MRLQLITGPPDLECYSHVYRFVLFLLLQEQSGIRLVLPICHNALGDKLKVHEGEV